MVRVRIGARFPMLTRTAPLATTPTSSRASIRKIQSPEMACPSVSIETAGAGSAGPGVKATRRFASSARPAGGSTVQRSVRPAGASAVSAAESATGPAGAQWSGPWVQAWPTLTSGPTVSSGGPV
jgi:hypothetical protein